MGFEVPVANVSGRRRGWIAPAAAAASALVVLIVLAAAAGTRSGDIAVATVPATGVVPQPARAMSRALPRTIDCRDVDDATCLRVARAAVLVLPDDLPPIRNATVWRSLLCNDNFDCPGPNLRRSVPLGSVIVRFVDNSPPAAVNVVGVRLTANARPGTRAWLVRWLPGSG